MLIGVRQSSERDRHSDVEEPGRIYAEDSNKLGKLTLAPDQTTKVHTLSGGGKRLRYQKLQALGCP